MKINISKKQYEIIIKALETSSFIFGPMSDFVDEKYKKDVDDIDKMEEYLLQFAKEFDFEKNLCESDPGSLHLNEDYYDKILDDLNLYDDQQLFEGLTHELGKRDFYNNYSKEEVLERLEKNGDYLGAPIYEFEKKYVDEINENGYSRFFIDKSFPSSKENDEKILNAK